MIVNEHSARGAKHTCADCATRFFDMGKLPALCPKCGKKVPVVKAAVRRPRHANAN